jgi:hypothetical protein
MVSPMSFDFGRCRPFPLGLGVRGVKWNFPNIKFPSKNNKPKRTAKVNINSNSAPSQQEIDAILDKISSGGYDSLTQKEKEKLFSASKNK